MSDKITIEVDKSELFLLTILVLGESERLDEGDARDKAIALGWALTMKYVDCDV